MNDAMMEQKLYECLQKVKAYLMKIGASKEDAEDVVQDTAYKFILYIDSISHKNVESWLFRVAVNGYYDLYRKGSRRKAILEKFNFQKLFEEDTPEKAALQNEVKKDLETIFSKLKPKQQQVLLMKYSLGLAIREISEFYGMKEDSVKTTLYRARKDFIKEYRRQGHE
ncbi:RNA polymerase sigma factor [Planomicrobium sp. CPCC 101079]|uniref:RNA polymerase sigma factor n=1 Tax=Planomicrobium sp. CPCC 101079 TaxID=2599618 RepID=UPI0011B63C11|nr:RNA polymerase sigma factor [Planomicrobium sp. CPCC 101079]TWT09234.1 RNA polymerase sigma factor [Planomicrobium sp. CPCC 101079]